MVSGMGSGGAQGCQARSLTHTWDRAFLLLREPPAVPGAAGPQPQAGTQPLLVVLVFFGLCRRDCCLRTGMGRLEPIGQSRPMS